MPLSCPLHVGVLLLCLAVPGSAAGRAAAAAEAEPSTLTVDLAAPGVPVSPLLYGIFFEEINHAGDGGLYAELVRNRSFEDARTPEGWSLVSEEGARAEVGLDESLPLNPRNPRSLKLEVTDLGSGRAGVSNGGYWGMGVRRGERYNLSLYARFQGSAAPRVTATLEGSSGKVYGRAVLGPVDTGWKQYRGRLTSSATDPKARLVLAVSAPGVVWLDQVSLFPQRTFKGRPNGLRRDLAEMLQALRPAFVRFPGGCFVEGDRLENATRWKETIGDVASRPGHWNLWGYRSTDGLGFHEYLQLCEDLEAEPLFVINCGMSHSGNVPMEELGPWVQDALDAVEYARGPVTSTWGALRARHGHPKPFRLRYLEVGNENGWGNALPAYEERYARFYDALKARYPDLQIVANVPVRNRPMDLLDDHYYNSPEWFAENADRYSRYDRGRPKVYVGEYAVTQNCGQGNLRAALGEAAFMTGLERNADVVRMASYAPLFVNVNDRKWNPDAIVFDSASAYGTPSYTVQQLFSRYRPEVSLPVELKARPSRIPTHGAIGLGTWLTQAEYRDVKVTSGGRTLLESDFSQGAPGWKVVHGEWQAVDGAYRQTEEADDRRAVAGDPSWTDYTLSLKARKLGGAEGFLVMFRVRDDANWYWWNLGGWGNTRHAVERSFGGGKSTVSGEVPGRIETGRWYDIRIDLQGSRVRCTLDGKLIHEFEDRGAPSLAASAGRVPRTGELILKVVNVSDSPQETEVRLAGGAAISPEAIEVVLTGRPEDENSLEQPRKVAPVTRRRSGLGNAFHHTFPANSLTILRLKEGER